MMPPRSGTGEGRGSCTAGKIGELGGYLKGKARVGVGRHPARGSSSAQACSSMCSMRVSATSGTSVSSASSK